MASKGPYAQSIGKDDMDSTSLSQRSKNILLLVHDWDYSPRRPYHVGLHLSRRGYNVSMLLPSETSLGKYRAKRINDRFTLHFCPTLLWGGFKKGTDPLDLVTKMHLVSKLKYDILFAFDSRPSVILPALYGRFLKRVPLIVDWTDWFGRGGTIAERAGGLYRFLFERVETFFEEHFRKYADSSTVICPILGKRLRALGYKKRIHLFPLGCHLSPLINVDRNSLRNKLGLPLNGPLIGCVGTLFPSDADLLFESFSYVRDKVDANLLLIGDNHFRQRYPIPEHAIVTGRVSSEDLQNHLACCDLGVMPLRNNIANNGRWPSKLNDYLAMGKPIVSTELSLVTELFQLCQFGEVARDTPDDFAEKICELLNDKERLELYGRNALTLASNHLSWPVLIDELDHFIRETVEASSH